MVSAVISGASPESTITWSYLESEFAAHISAWPVPRWGSCNTNCTPVCCTESRTFSASCPTITKRSFAGVTCWAAAITCDNNDLPPTWCRTLGCFDFSRVPLPAAMIAIAVRKFGADFIEFQYNLRLTEMAQRCHNGTQYSQPFGAAK